ncbi:MAG: ribbon-helix-helix domain-containing protein [Phycisphaerales bacterium]
MKKIPISVALDPQLVDEIDSIAESLGESRSAVVERVLRNGLQDERASIAALANPLVAKLLDHPKFMSALAAVVGEELTVSEVETVGKKSKAAREKKKPGRRPSAKASPA